MSLSDAKYGDRAISAFRGAHILWTAIDGDYQGTAALIGALPDGRLFFYEWSWGSCSACDDWLARDLSDADIESEMRKQAAYFADPAALLFWLDLTTITGAYLRPKRAEVEPLLVWRNDT